MAHAARIQTWYWINERTLASNVGVTLYLVSQVNKWKNYGFIEWAAARFRHEQTPTSDIIKHNARSDTEPATPHSGDVFTTLWGRSSSKDEFGAITAFLNKCKSILKHVQIHLDILYVPHIKERRMKQGYLCWKWDLINVSINSSI